MANRSQIKIRISDERKRSLYLMAESVGALGQRQWNDPVTGRRMTSKASVSVLFNQIAEMYEKDPVAVTEMFSVVKSRIESQ